MDKTKIRISASRIELLHSCSYLFYLREIERLPDIVHPKTIIGLMVHSILECLKNPRHKIDYDIIKKDGNINNCKSINRLIAIYKSKYNISDILISEINGMIMVAINNIDFFFNGAIQKFKPEHRFLIKLADFEIKGFIDDLAEYPERFVIRDFKSRGQRFKKNELPDNFQASVYQLYVWETFKKPAIVQFVLLRFPPTKRTPDKHVQIVEEKTGEELEGFKVYLKYIGGVMNNFGYDDSIKSFCKDEGFCKYVCQFKSPFDYKILLDSEGKILKTVRMEEKLEAINGQKIEIKHFSGCPKWHGINNL